jgi:hypothetical protein
MAGRRLKFTMFTPRRGEFGRAHISESKLDEWGPKEERYIRQDGADQILL